MENWQKDWKIIDIMELRGISPEINEDIDTFCVERENGSARLLSLDEEELELYPALIPFLLSKGYDEDDTILGWISW